jgi:predicted nucleotidyltransferase
MKRVNPPLLEKTIPVPSDLRSPIEQSAAILKEFGAEAIYLFGSIVDGKFHDDSDIDMAVSGLAPNKFFEAMGQILLILPRPLDLIDLDDDTAFTRYLKQKLDQFFA